MRDHRRPEWAQQASGFVLTGELGAHVTSNAEVLELYRTEGPRLGVQHAYAVVPGQALIKVKFVESGGHLWADAATGTARRSRYVGCLNYKD